MTDCETFLDEVNAVLDGDAPASELATGHPLTCRDCRKLAAAARLLAAAGPHLQTLPPVPADLTPRLVMAMTRRRRRVWLPALAACLTVAGGIWMSRPSYVGWAESSRPTMSTGAPTVGVENSARPTKAPRVADQWAAVASVARSASEKATAPTRLLTSPSMAFAVARPTGDPLASLGSATRAATAPVADSTRRAVGLFLRDLGLSAKPAG